MFADGEWVEGGISMKQGDLIEVVVNKRTGTLLFYLNSDSDAVFEANSADLVSSELYPIAVSISSDFIKQ